MLRTVLLAGLLAAACGCVCATGRILDGGGNDAIQIDAPDAPDVALDRVPDGADAPEGEADVPSDSDAADADGGCTTGYACGASCVLDCTSCPGAPLRCAEQCVPSCAGCASGDVNCANVCAADCAACAGDGRARRVRRKAH